MDIILAISWSRCLWCGRKTPHEVCHIHGNTFNPTDLDIEALKDRPNYDMEPEVCDLPDGHV